jgi:hypothetical protein
MKMALDFSPCGKMLFSPFFPSLSCFCKNWRKKSEQKKVSNLNRVGTVAPRSNFANCKTLEWAEKFMKVNIYQQYVSVISLLSVGDTVRSDYQNRSSVNSA